MSRACPCMSPRIVNGRCCFWMRIKADCCLSVSIAMKLIFWISSCVNGTWISAVGSFLLFSVFDGAWKLRISLVRNFYNQKHLFSKLLFIIKFSIPFFNLTLILKIPCPYLQESSNYRVQKLQIFRFQAGGTCCIVFGTHLVLISLVRLKSRKRDDSNWAATSKKTLFSQAKKWNDWVSV